MTVLAQEPVPDDLLPFGWVDCGVIDVVGDDTSDDDQDPGSVPVVGDGLIVFIPKITEMRVMRNGRSTLVRNRPVPANLDQDGVIELAGHRLVKLWHGVWTCTPGNRNILDFDAFDFELTGNYTLASPAPLWHLAPYDPPDGVTVTTMEVPSGQQPGQTLAWDGSQLAWVTPTITPSVSTLPASSNATASFAGQWPDLTLALGIPRGADGSGGSGGGTGETDTGWVDLSSQLDPAQLTGSLAIRRIGITVHLVGRLSPLEGVTVDQRTIPLSSQFVPRQWGWGQRTLGGIMNRDRGGGTADAEAKIIAEGTAEECKLGITKLNFVGDVDITWTAGDAWPAT